MCSLTTLFTTALPRLERHGAKEDGRVREYQRVQVRDAGSGYYSRTCSLTTERVHLLQNVFSYYSTCSLAMRTSWYKYEMLDAIATTECVL